MTVESSRGDSGSVGVAAALPRVLIRLREEVRVEEMDRLWIFPPVRRGRRERGLIVVSTFTPTEERRAMLTVAYSAERTGAGTSIEPAFTWEGEAPPDRFPGMMLGVVARSAERGGEAREVEISGDAVRFEELMEEFDAGFIESVEP